MDNKNEILLQCCHTSSDDRSKTLPPIVNETLGIEEIFPQSTNDSPLGLGIRSQSCKNSRGNAISYYKLNNSLNY